MTSARRPLATGLFALLAVGLYGVTALADLAEDAGRLERAWDRAGDAVTLPPRVLTHGTLLPLPLPVEATAPGEGCTTVAVLGALSTGFILRFLPGDGPDRENETPEPSVAGAAQLVRCGRDRGVLSRLAIEMRSPRGVLTTVVGQADRPLPSLRRILLHREPGSTAAASAPGPRPAPGPLRERVQRLEERSRREGAEHFERRLVPAGDTGAQRILLALEPGCHRVSVLGVSPESGQHGLDLDAELRWADTGSVASIDRTDSPDAMVSGCTGVARTAVLTFAGALPSIPVVVAHAAWALPSGLRDSWGPEPRARITQVLWENQIRPPETGPIYESLGVSGSTLLSVETEPDACYLVAVGVMRETPKHLTLVVTHGAVQAASHDSGRDGAALVAFCADGASRAKIEVEAHGTGVAWLLAAWRTGRTVLGEQDVR